MTGGRKIFLFFSQNRFLDILCPAEEAAEAAERPRSRRGRLHPVEDIG